MPEIKYLPPKEITLLEGQANLLKDFDSTILAAIAGTGGGKTMTGYWWLHSRMETYPGNTWLMVEPTYGMLSKVILTSSDPGRPSLFDYFKMIGHHPKWVSKVYNILGTNFGKIYMGSADNPNSYQGAAVKGAWLDEPGQMSLLAHETAFQRISMMRGQELLTTTPYNLGWLLHDIKEKDGQEGIHVESWRSIDRPGFPREAYELARQTLPPWRFRMLYDAQFERPAGLIYDSFDEACIIDRFEINDDLHKNWPVYVGHDFGEMNPAAIFYIQDPGTGYFYVCAEFKPREAVSVYGQVERFKEIVWKHNVLKRIGGSHQEKGWRDDYTAQGWPIFEPKENLRSPDVRIQRVWALHKLNKIFVFRDCVNYIDEKRTFSRELDDENQPIEKIQNEARFHLMSAEQYIMSDFVPETVKRYGVRVSYA